MNTSDWTQSNKIFIFLVLIRLNSPCKAFYYWLLSPLKAQHSFHFIHNVIANPILIRQFSSHVRIYNMKFMDTLVLNQNRIRTDRRCPKWICLPLIGAHFTRSAGSIGKRPSYQLIRATCELTWEQYIICAKIIDLRHCVKLLTRTRVFNQPVDVLKVFPLVLKPQARSRVSLFFMKIALIFGDVMSCAPRYS